MRRFRYRPYLCPCPHSGLHSLDKFLFEDHKATNYAKRNVPNITLEIIGGISLATMEHNPCGWLVFMDCLSHAWICACTLSIDFPNRYQVLAGVIEQRILEPLLHQHKLMLSAVCFAVRTGNTFLGSLM